MLKNKYTSKDTLFVLLFLSLGLSLIIGVSSGNISNGYNDIEIVQERQTEQPRATESDIICSLNSVDCNEISPVEKEIREIAEQENFQWSDYLVRLAKCESTLNPNARNDNGRYGTDRGVFQINDHYHPEVSTECADNINCATTWTIDMINSGNQNQWSCDKLI